MAESISVKRQVNLKVIVTPTFKQQLEAELEEAAQTTQRQLEQLEYAARHYLTELQKQDLNKALQARQEIEGERQRLERLQKEVQERKQQVAHLEEGSEYLRGAIEGVVELRPGDNLEAALGNASLIVKDGVVVEIRDGR